MARKKRRRLSGTAQAKEASEIMLDASGRISKLCRRSSDPDVVDRCLAEVGLATARASIRVQRVFRKIKE